MHILICDLSREKICNELFYLAITLVPFWYVTFMINSISDGEHHQICFIKYPVSLMNTLDYGSKMDCKWHDLSTMSE